MSEQGTSLQTPPTTGALPLSFEAWAELSARMMNLDQERRFEILEEHKVKPADWQRSDEHYLRAMATDIAAGCMDRADRYAQRCVAEMTRRRAQADASPPVAVDEPPKPAEPKASMKIGAPLEAPAAATPSFLQAQPLPAAPLARGPSELVATADVFQLPTALKSGAIPFKPSPNPSPMGSPSEPTTARAAAENAGETLPLTGTVVLGATLPFGTRSADRQSAPVFPRMPLPTYAAFCAERALSPERVDEVLKKYNVRSDVARTALDQDWQARFAAHPDTKAAWQRLVDEHRDRLLRGPR